MSEYPRMLYRDSLQTTLIVSSAEDEDSARADGWMRLREFKEAQAAPAVEPEAPVVEPETPRRRGRPPKEPVDANSGEGPPEQ